MLMQLIAAIFGFSVIMGLPTEQPNTPTTPVATTENPHLMPNPCGGEMDPEHIPSETDLNESLNELSPNTLLILSKVESLKVYMATNRIQSSMMRNIAEKMAAGNYPADEFPHPPSNFFSNDMFSDLYKNMSMLEIYYSSMVEVEKSYQDDNDAEILNHMTQVIDAAQKNRCHLQVILRFYELSIPTVAFNVDDNKINSSNRSTRYMKHYQIFHMTKVFADSLSNFLKNF